jgi:hypothetical protein
MYRNNRIKVMGAEKVIPLIGILGVAGLASHYYTEMEKEKNVSPLRNTSFAQPTAQQLEEIEAVKAQAIEEYKDENEDIVDTWSEWLPNLYGGEYFENFMDDEFEEDNPFKSSGRVIKGEHTWKNTSKLKLIDDDGVSYWADDSGGLKLKVKQGFQILLKISTDDAGYFQDDVSEDGPSTTTLYSYSKALGRTAKKGSAWSSSKSKVTVPLNGDDGDYLSVDIDSEHSGIRAFRVCSLGRCFSDDSKNPDDGVYVKLEQVNRRNPNYDPTKFSAESYSFNATTPANVGRLAKAWKGITTALSTVNPLKRFGKVGGAVIKGTSVVKGQVVIGRSGKNLGKVESAVAITDTIAKKPSILLGKGVNKVEDGRSTLQSGYVVKRGGQFIEGSSDTGKYTKGVFKLRNGDELIRVADVGSSGGSGFGNVINLRNAGRSVLVAGTGATIGVIFTIADMIPGLLGDGIEDLACSLTGSCCEEKCEDSDNPDCVEECQEAADDKAVKFGGLVVVGIIGLALVFRGGKSEKSAEEYVVMRRG